MPQISIFIALITLLFGSCDDTFTLQNARIKGALLTATKVYTDGTSESFEEFFNNRTTAIGNNPNEISTREVQ